MSSGSTAYAYGNSLVFAYRISASAWEFAPKGPNSQRKERESGSGRGQQDRQARDGLWVALPSCIPKTRAVQASDRGRLSDAIGIPDLLDQTVSLKRWGTCPLWTQHRSRTVKEPCSRGATSAEAYYRETYSLPVISACRLSPPRERRPLVPLLKP
ncbi:hypothetical protein LY76DRAFT_178737 [Colletotrichum caudatum]|nr:hypothetical protein LY76DRAFT_178737 [Colletotrichum caudatum]